MIAHSTSPTQPLHLPITVSRCTVSPSVPAWVQDDISVALRCCIIDRKLLSRVQLSRPLPLLLEICFRAINTIRPALIAQAIGMLNTDTVLIVVISTIHHSLSSALHGVERSRAMAA